jgi:lipopolysaccharide/colanic/teichoic acid biosynthesis glycosyltransferase
MKPASFGLTGFLTTTALRRADRSVHDDVKRPFELLVALLALVVASPLMLLFGIIVRLTSKGPALYAQERLGKDGKPFTIYKLRTMRVDAELSGARWAVRNDPRVTPIGRFLRKTHLDELPQLFNVVLGQMSLIGPRPERPCFVHKLQGSVPLYATRLAVRPGITGLAQVKHHYDRSIEDVQTKLGYDLEYIRRACLLLDVQILALTVAKVLAGRGGSC